MGNEGIDHHVESLEQVDGRTTLWKINGVPCKELQDDHAKLIVYNPQDSRDKRFYDAMANALDRRENFMFANFEPKGRTSQALAAIATGMQPYPMMCREEAIKAWVYDSREPEPRAPWRIEGISTESP